ncbi:lasso RiPP family leader peptide-containing protein [Streptomyces sp. NBC_01803]|nr:lasso RiPP family leader peptide-containing protein [Streptomyces sp. NBC_01803]WSA44540.1 lasso RiPP family leader peptide-containing protein [Streptomyces sp. NBC_01803]
MEQEPRIEEPEVYEPPVLAEVGGFADETMGNGGFVPDGIHYQYKL